MTEPSIAKIATWQTNLPKVQDKGEARDGDSDRLVRQVAVETQVVKLHCLRSEADVFQQRYLILSSLVIAGGAMILALAARRLLSAQDGRPLETQSQLGQLEAGDRLRVVQVDGSERRYRVYVPRSYVKA